MKGHTYVASISLSLSSLKQAEDFIYRKTEIGKTIADDLQEQGILDAFESGDDMIADVDFPDGMSEAVQKELDAAVRVGAEFTLTLRWEKDE